ncbi:MAG: hypothetical protein ACR2I0_15890 [Rhodoferax sp.]
MCNHDCDQGRNCRCGNNPRLTQTSTTAVLYGLLAGLLISALASLGLLR